MLYIKESYNELLTKVTWPTWGELLESGRVVIVASVIIALIIKVMDVISLTFLQFLYDLT